jgi:hypothetical protein
VRFELKIAFCTQGGATESKFSAILVRTEMQRGGEWQSRRFWRWVAQPANGSPKRYTSKQRRFASACGRLINSAKDLQGAQA